MTSLAESLPARPGRSARHRNAGPGTVPGPVVPADRSGMARDQARAVRSWPLVLLAMPAAAEVWSGWVGIAQKTGFGLVHPLPGIWPSLHLDTTITLPIGVEAYAAYALRAWLATEDWISDRTRQFAKRSAICSFLLGMAGQVAYHLLVQAGQARAPWPVTTIVSCLPVLFLAMGTALAHMLRGDAAAGTENTGPSTVRSSAKTTEDRTVPDQGRTAGGATPRPMTVRPHGPSPSPRTKPRSQAKAPAGTEIDRARLVARELAAAGKPVSRRSLRDSGIKGSNEALNALALILKAETASPATPP
jgi:hypothetical protein